MYKAFVPKGKGNIHRGSGKGGKSPMVWYNGMYGNWSWFPSGALTFFNDKGLGKNKDKGKGMGKGKNKDKGKENRKDKGMGKDQGRQEEAAEVCDSGGLGHWSDDEEAEAAAAATCMPRLEALELVKAQAVMHAYYNRKSLIGVASEAFEKAGGNDKRCGKGMYAADVEPRGEPGAAGDVEPQGEPGADNDNASDEEELSLGSLLDQVGLAVTFKKKDEALSSLRHLRRCHQLMLGDWTDQALMYVGIEDYENAASAVSNVRTVLYRMYGADVQTYAEDDDEEMS